MNIVDILLTQAKMIFFVVAKCIDRGHT